MDKDKFTISARHIHCKLLHKISFRDWWVGNVAKLLLVEGEDFCTSQKDHHLPPTVARRVILSSRWCKRPGAIELLANLNDVAPARPAQTPPAYEAVNVWPWAGAENLYDPAVVGEIERDSPTGKRRYQIRRTPTTKAEESPWLKDADALEHWLISRGVCLVEKWNLPIPIHADATLDLVRYRVGGKRLYCYTRGTFIVVSDWLNNGEELEVWLRGMGACADPEPQCPHGEPADEPEIPGWRIQYGKAYSAGPCPKCGAGSGDDWSQCDGACPMPMSPHYLPVTADRQFGGQANNRAIEAQKAGTAPDPFVPPLEKVKSSWPPPEMMAEMLADMNEMEAAADAEEEPYPHALEIVPAAEAVVDADTGGLIPREIDGFVIHQRTKDGYVNATAMCKAADKRINNYLRNDVTREFLSELSSVALIRVTDLVVVNQGGTPAEQGTWVHPDVAINLAQWCSSKFAVQVSRWVHDWLTTGKTPTAPVLDISDPHSMMVWLNQASSIALQKTAENERLMRQLGVSRQLLGAVAQDLTKAKEDLTVKEEKVDFLEKTVESVKTSEARTVDLLMARLDVSDKAIPPTEFFKQTATVLGLSSDEGFDYLVAAKIFEKPVKNKWGTNQYKPAAPYDKCGYFQPAYRTNHRSTYDEETGLKTDLVQTERLVTYHITADKLDKDGNITKLGGFRWLLEKAMKSWRTLLNRMIAETGGINGDFRKLVGAKTRRVADSEIPCVDAYKEFCVIISKLPSGGIACAHKTKDGCVVRSEGATQREAFVKLNEQL